MHLPFDTDETRDTEDVLRSVGAVLDTIRARSVLIRGSESGFLLRAQVAATLRDRLEDKWTALDRHITSEDLVRYRREAVARRGTGHVAGPHERSLRVIGRQIDEQGLVDVTIIQYRTEGSWLLWHGDSSDGPSLVILDDDKLFIRDAREAAARQARAGARHMHDPEGWLDGLRPRGWTGAPDTGGSVVAGKALLD